MFRLRATAAAASVAFVTALSVFVAAGPAKAATSDPPGIGDIAQAVLTWNPGDVANFIAGNCINQGDCRGLHDPAIGGWLPEDEPMPWMQAIATSVGGTPAEVAAGTKVASQACRTGWGCVGIAGLGVGALAAGWLQTNTETWWPWLKQQFLGGPQLEVRYYPSQVPSQSCTADFRIDYLPGLNTPGYPAPTGYMAYLGTSAKSTDGGFCNVGGLTFAYDFRSKVDGTIWHGNVGASYWTGNGTLDWRGPFDQNTTFSPLPYGLGWDQVELYRLHWNQTDDGQSTGNSAKGAWWGQEPELNPTDTLSATIECRRANGTTYTRELISDAGLGGIQVPTCDPGDTAVTVGTDVIGEDLKRTPQTRQNLDAGRDLGNEVFSECAATSCQWQIKHKTTLVPCTTYDPSCVEWTTHKGDFLCFYGPYRLPMDQCYWMERVYETNPQTIPATGPNTDGDPNTTTGPEVQPSPGPSPSPTPTVTVTTAPSPTVSGNPSAHPSATIPTVPEGEPPPVPGGSGNPVPEDAAGNQCWPHGWGVWNPAEWVLQPIKCAVVGVRTGPAGADQGSRQDPGQVGSQGARAGDHRRDRRDRGSVLGRRVSGPGHAVPPRERERGHPSLLRLHGPHVDGRGVLARAVLGAHRRVRWAVHRPRSLRWVRVQLLDGKGLR